MQRALAFLLFCQLFLTSSLFCQAQDKYDIQYFTVESDITGVQRDDNNEFVWMATENGVIRFDGLHFIHFNSGNCPFIKRDKMKMLGKSEKGGIFAANATNIFLIEDNKLKPYEKNIINNRENLFNKITNLYLGRKTVPKIHSYDFESKFFSINDSSYLIRKQNTLYGYTASAVTPFFKRTLNKGDYLFKLDEDMYLLTEQNIFYQFDAIANKLTKVNADWPLLNNINNRILFWQAGEENTILISGTNAWTIEHYNHGLKLNLICSQVPTGAMIKYAEYDEKDGILILATDKKSIIVIHSTATINLLKKNNSNHNEINSYYGQIELGDGNVLTNTGDIIGGKPTEKINLNEFDYNNYVVKDNKIWYTLHDSLFSYDRADKKVKFHFAVNTGKHFVIAEMDSMLCFADVLGIGYFDDTALHYLYRNNKDQEENEFPSILTALSPNTLAIGKSSGLFYYNLQAKHFDTILATKNTVETIWQNGNYVFIGTDGDGYYIYKQGAETKQMPLDKGNYLLNVHCIIPDDYGYIWMSTDRGLLKANKNDLIRAYEKGNPQVFYYYFGKNDGLDVLGINGGCQPCALKLKNGKFSFPTVNGLLWVAPDAHLRLPEGNIFVDKITVDNKTVNRDSFSYYSLSYDTRDIALTISFPAWCNIENLYLQYQIYPYSSRWDIIPIRTPVLHIGKLPPGSYTLRIRKLNGFGANNYTYKEINFTIAKPWYKTIKFYLLCGLLTIGLTILLFRLITLQYKRR
ncbi:MAG: hypothetical protein ACTHJ0_04100, partial [Flavipsychrobacter sp.]